MPAELGLERFQERFPLSAEWSSLETFSQRLEWGELSVGMVGLAVRGGDDLVVTASAAEQGALPAQRAYFELIERCAIFEATKRAGPLRAFSRDHLVSQDVAAQEVFPKSAQPELWRYSLSSGVACHSAWEHACDSALWEVLERDRLMRAWKGELKPVNLEAGELAAAGLTKSVGALSHLYDFEAYGFGAQPYVAALFGFPKEKSAPFLCGYGARQNLDAALAHAERECLQRLGFLWGEDWEGALPEFSPTAEYHQEVYLRPDGVARIRDWLRRQAGRPDAAIEHGTPLYADITPDALKGKLHVVRALVPGAIPLAFGRAPFLEGLPLHFIT